MVTKKKRAQVSLEPSLYDEIKAMAKAKSVTMSAILNLSVQSGYMALKMAENADWQKYFESQMEDKKL